MLYGLTIKPTWYEGATEDEKSKYDAKTKSKVAALECAIEIMSDAEKLNALRDNARKIADAINSVLGKQDFYGDAADAMTYGMYIQHLKANGRYEE